MKYVIYSDELYPNYTIEECSPSDPPWIRIIELTEAELNQIQTTRQAYIETQDMLRAKYKGAR